jgi:hypothetical protein
MDPSLLPDGVFAATNMAESLGAGCLAAGVVLTVIGAWQRRTVLRLVADGRRATATAVDSVRRPTVGPGADTHHVVWRFETDAGVVVEHEGLASGVHHPAEGQQATIIYDPADPHNARLENMAERTLAWALFFFTGLALLAIGLAATVVAVAT